MPWKRQHFLARSSKSIEWSEIRSFFRPFPLLASWLVSTIITFWRTCDSLLAMHSSMWTISNMQVSFEAPHETGSNYPQCWRVARTDPIKLARSACDNKNVIGDVWHNQLQLRGKRNSPEPNWSALSERTCNLDHSVRPVLKSFLQGALECCKRILISIGGFNNV